MRDNMSDFFEYNNLKYPYKTIYFPNFDCHYIVATEDLEHKLLPNGETYHSETAKDIDERIFFFVPNEVFFKDDDYIAQFIGDLL